MPFPVQRPFRRCEVLPVPPRLIHRVWRRHVLPWIYDIPDFDLHRCRSRLLSGEDRLWLAALLEGYLRKDRASPPYIGVLFTTVSDEQPFDVWPSDVPKLFRRKDPALRRSLVVHIAGGKACNSWIDNAVERISAYGREQKCRQLYVLARRRWREHACKFWARDWDIVGYSRDRPTEARGVFPSRNKVGFYRVVLPKENMRMQDYETGRFCYFSENPPKKIKKAA